MLYPVIIHKDSNSDYGLIMPDFPGVFSGGESMKEVLANVQDAIETWFDDEVVENLPKPSTLEQIEKLEEAESGIIEFVTINFDFLERKESILHKKQKINFSYLEF